MMDALERSEAYAVQGGEGGHIADAVPYGSGEGAGKPPPQLGNVQAGFQGDTYRSEGSLFALHRPLAMPSPSVPLPSHLLLSCRWAKQTDPSHIT
jgi:hypothetical protein